MSVPTPVAETYIPCSGLTGTIGGAGLAVMTGGFSAPVTVDDMTNNQGYGFHEDVATVKVGNVKMSIALKGSATGLKSGDIYEVLINCTVLPTVTAGVMADPTPTVTGGPAFAGNVRIILDDAPILDVKAGAKISFSGTTQGPFSYVI